MKNKLVSIKEAVDMIKDGDTLMIGGFLAVGSPLKVIDALVETDKGNFTLIANDTSFVDRGIGKLVVAKKFKTIYASHIGTNKETGRQMSENETEVNLVPQGTLIEQVRAGAYGLGGILTPTGVGTEVEKGKQKITIDGKEYLLELAKRGDVSLIFANVADKAGNLKYHGSTQNYNVAMAGASKITIVYAEKVVEVGQISQDEVKVPGVLVDYIIDGGAING
ncbi:MAG: 3-oxoacid CoA-transferase subunit A [Fusobacterium gastrosuis]|uniref:3-oxoacid CoA-transferase subunit A n=1 Tax=Fusobacterium TaxID=848 RepID=UPI001F4F9B86|nr:MULTISPECIES: 3-oxoacid CoA-transferase subunit A [Fusobacterium]MDD7391501.1 3-oxoacid CoA-transferase subunit A [Fusobacteriaceae bacterium]MCI5724796.1 3-oxoacid CoA-transferase subunit A [Fusobacterium sp.]MCI7223826.1 3-oxoacid CoA-transferase subunit A [Fusobacterium sp.]MDD7410294.1 3-oxoacid CoA-transferase subunit A [Fusobacteriaceae bacterium]MDY4010587.1 3-oxoacid CoA-transferase subunit A [Fusobacterium gastrosuis]